MARYAFFLFLYWFPGANAQVDTTVLIENIEISNTIVRSSTVGSTLDQVHCEAEDLSLARSIQRQTNVYMKNYGPGSLTTTSIRGGSAGQTLVLWNGLPLHSPMLGLLDLSLIPSSRSDKIAVIKGGSSSLWGSGAVSGLIDVASAVPEHTSYSSATTIGSFGTRGQTAEVNLQAGKWHSSTNIIHESSNRDFTYEPAPGLPLTQQTHARYHRNHVRQNLYFEASKSQQFYAHLWAYEAATELPPTTVQNRSEAHQEDKALRSILGWKHTGSKSITNLKIAHFIDQNDYFDPSTLTTALNRFSTSFADASTQHQLGQQALTMGATFSRTSAHSDGYQGVETERRLGIFASYLVELKRLKLQASLRQEFVDGHKAPFLPSVGLSYSTSSWWTARAKISRDFRLPTLNDRYWRPGGNVDLLPEQGWSQEIGFDMSHRIFGLTVAYDITAFNRSMNNWIMWSPAAGQAYWSAQNIQAVQSRGLEQAISAQSTIRKIDFEIEMQYSYIRSTFGTTMTLPMIDEGDQLFYTPRHQGTITAAAAFKGLSCNYAHNITGSTIGTNEVLPSFHAADFSIKYTTALGPLQSGLGLSINNVWNKRYFIVERRPLPGINYQITLTLTY